MTPRVGQFLTLRRAQVHVLVWSEGEERFLDQTEAPADTVDTLARQCRGMALDKGLAAYPMAQSVQWMALSRNITAEALAAVLPVRRAVRSAPLLTAPPPAEAGEAEGKAAEPPAAGGGSGSDAEEPPSAAQLLAAEAAAVVGAAGEVPGSRFFFTPLPGTTPSCAVPWRTAYGVDPSGALVAAAAAAGGLPALLTQLQVSFVAFLLGQSLQGFTAWKHLFDACARAEWLLSGGYGAGDSATVLPSTLCPPRGSKAPPPVGDALEAETWTAVLTAMTAQVGQLPGEFGEDELTRGNFLRGALRRLRGILARHGDGGSGVMAPGVQRAAAALLAAGRTQLLQADARPAVLQPSPPKRAVVTPPGIGRERLTRSDVLAILGPDWDGDEDDDLPVVVDTISNLSIS